MKLIKQKNGIYAARFKDGGGNYRVKSLGSRDIKQARVIARESKIAELETAAKIGAITKDTVARIVTGGKIRFKVALQEWVNWRDTYSKSPNSTYNYLTFIEAFANLLELHDKPLSSVTPEMVNSFVNSKDQASRSTRNIRLTALRMFFEWASIKALILHNPAAKEEVRVNVRNLTHAQKEKKVKIPFTPKEYIKIINNTDGFWRVASALSFYTGMRLGDIVCLEWESIKDDTIIAHTLKRDKRVVLPLKHKELGKGTVLRYLSTIEKNDSIYCFPREREIYIDPKRKSGLSVSFGRILQRLDITGKSFHCFRHTCVTRMARSGTSLEDIAKLVGHSSTDTTEIYKH
jgi:integrase